MRFEEIRSADRRIGGGPESGGARRGGVNAAPIEGAGVEMTGGRIYWPLGRIVTFRTTIYDDWNSGQSNPRNTQQRGREGGGEVTDERHLAKLVQLARAPDEKGFSDRRIRLVTNFLMGIIHLYRPGAGYHRHLLLLLFVDLDFPPRWNDRSAFISAPCGNGI